MAQHGAKAAWEEEVLPPSHEKAQLLSLLRANLVERLRKLESVDVTLDDVLLETRLQVGEHMTKGSVGEASELLELLWQVVTPSV